MDGEGFLSWGGAEPGKKSTGQPGRAGKGYKSAGRAGAHTVYISWLKSYATLICLALPHMSVGGGHMPRHVYARICAHVRVRWENLIFHNFKFGKVPPPMVFRYAQIGWGKKVGQIYIHNHDRYYDHNHCLVLSYSRPSLSDKPVDEVGIK